MSIGAYVTDAIIIVDRMPFSYKLCSKATDQLFRMRNKVMWEEEQGAPSFQREVRVQKAERRKVMGAGDKESLGTVSPTEWICKWIFVSFQCRDFTYLW